MEKKKKKSGRAGTIILVLVLVFFIGAMIKVFYGMVTDDGGPDKPVVRTETQKLIDKNLDMTYPATEREVMKLYCKIVKEMYSGECSDEDVQDLYDQLRKLFDDELLANNPYNAQYDDLLGELESFTANEKRVINYAIEDEDDIKYGTYEGKEQALINITFSVKKGAKWQRVNEEFVLRKDDEGRWKILGWYKTEVGVGENENEE